MPGPCPFIVASALALVAARPVAVPASTATDRDADDRGSVIFIHPDGASAATWTAFRALEVGPDGDLEWDRLPAVAVYRGHMADSLTATSNGGATTHAFGVKVESDAFGRTAGFERGRDIVDADGASLGVAHQAMRAGIPVGLVQTGIAPEPGSACYVASDTRRQNYFSIAASLVESGADVLLSGGERHFLPAGVAGVHGPGERTDGRNLVEEARARGYAIVHTRDELLALPDDTERVLGLFAYDATFNATTEERLAQLGLPHYAPHAPTSAEMTEAAIRILSRGDRRFLLVVEEEGTDNFGNANNASGTFEALRRADATIGVARRFVAERPDTLVITTADSDGGGMRMVGIVHRDGSTIPTALPARTGNGAPIDGVAGTGSAPFLAAPDRAGRRLPFYVVWSSPNDVSGGVLVRAEGLNSELVRGTFDNTDLVPLMRRTLFGREAAESSER